MWYLSHKYGLEFFKKIIIWPGHWSVCYIVVLYENLGGLKKSKLGYFLKIVSHISRTLSTILSSFLCMFPWKVVGIFANLTHLG